MSEQHITSMLENTRFGSLSESDLSRIRAHTVSCADCARAYRVASVSASLLENRMAETFEPSPFFHTRVLAAVREKQNEGSAAFSRLWRAAGALVSSMAAAVVLFAVLSFGVLDQQSLPTDASATAYSAEALILDDVDEEQTDGQVLTTLYEADE